MDDKKKNEKLAEGTGRLPYDKQNDETLQEKAARDISEIDQQEGSMNHGAVGGNFDKPIDEQKDSSND
jgi:hypothetical protein